MGANRCSGPDKGCRDIKHGKNSRFPLEKMPDKPLKIWTGRRLFFLKDVGFGKGLQSKIFVVLGPQSFMENIILKYFYESCL